MKCGKYILDNLTHILTNYQITSTYFEKIIKGFNFSGRKISSAFRLTPLIILAAASLGSKTSKSHGNLFVKRDFL